MFFGHSAPVRCPSPMHGARCTVPSVRCPTRCPVHNARCTRHGVFVSCVPCFFEYSLLVSFLGFPVFVTMCCLRPSFLFKVPVFMSFDRFPRFRTCSRFPFLCFCVCWFVHVFVVFAFWFCLLLLVVVVYLCCVVFVCFPFLVSGFGSLFPIPFAIFRFPFTLLVAFLSFLCLFPLLGFILLFLLRFIGSSFLRCHTLSYLI